MKSFKQHLKEYIGVSVNDYIFNSYNYPLSTPMLERIFKELPRVIAYHITSPKYLNNLFKIEGSKKSISVFTKANSSNIKFGIESTGGLVVKISGNLLAKGDYDIYSNVDDHGRRWIDLGYLNDRDDMIKFIKNVRKVAFKKFTSNELQDDFQWTKFQELENKKDKNKLIKIFFDVIEEMSKKYYKTVFNFIMGISRSYIKDSTYNELVINKIKIKHIYIIKDNDNYLKRHKLFDFLSDKKFKNVSITEIFSYEFDKIKE